MLRSALTFALAAFTLILTLRIATPQDNRRLAYEIDQAVAEYHRLYQQGRFADAAAHAERFVELAKQLHGPDHPQVGNALSRLADLYEQMGRAREAEPLLKRELQIRENTVGTDHPDTATALNNLAGIYRVLGRMDEARRMAERSLAVVENAQQPDADEIATMNYNVAIFDMDDARLETAEARLVRALELKKAVHGPMHLDVALVRVVLGELYRRQGRFPDAELSFKQALYIGEKLLGPNNKDLAAFIGGLAYFYRTQGRLSEAEPLYKKRLDIIEKVLGPDHPELSDTLHNLALLHLERRDWQVAADFWRRAENINIRSAEREPRGRYVLSSFGQSLTGKERVGPHSANDEFLGFVKSLYRVLSASENPDFRKVMQEAFQAAQWAQHSSAAASLAQMAARGASGNAKLDPIVRNRQDLLAEWQWRDRLRMAAAANGAQQRDRRVEAENAAKLGDIEARVAAIDARLAKDFPDYLALSHPRPIPIEGVRANLLSDEALVLFLETPEFKPLPTETFIWVVTKSDVRWVRSELGTKALAERVTALRCGLDDEEWAGIEKPARCAKLLQVAKPGEKDPLPFSLAIAHELYQALFGSVEDLIMGKHLLIVSAGPLTSLPFQVLVTEKPGTAMPKTYAGYRDVTWLGKRQPLTVLPSVASLRALREFAKGGRGSQDYIGYGDPVLEGDGSCRKITAPDACPGRQTAVTQAPNQVHQPRSRSGRRSPVLTEVFRKGARSEGMLTQVRALCPLDDTAYEVKCIAQSLPKSKIRIRDDATVASVKALSDNGELATYRVVHFATHGLLAGDVELMTRLEGEPALVLTPPREPRDSDDNGLLTASKVAELKLNADWVVLSACNTAAGDGMGAEALSGLARAFFYAGARALLVSHWPVYSDAAVRLTTRAFAETEGDANVTRAEAMRRSMVALMNDASEEDNAHPSVWAPFVLVGEGGR